jgi:hypothetical protein
LSYRISFSAYAESITGVVSANVALKSFTIRVNASMGRADAHGAWVQPEIVRRGKPPIFPAGNWWIAAIAGQMCLDEIEARIGDNRFSARRRWMNAVAEADCSRARRM